MEENKIPATEVAENAGEQTAEETVATEEVKTYTEEEMNQRADELVAKKLGRKEAKIKKAFEEKMAPYREAEAVLNAGLGTSNITDAISKMREFYNEQGIEIPEHNHEAYSDDDMKILAAHEAQRIIESGIEEVIEETNRLADKGTDKMTPREKLIFAQLAQHRKAEQDKQDLAKMGVGEEALSDKDFLEFAKDLNPQLSVKEKYEKYLKYRPKKEIETIGSMKGVKTGEEAVKDFYSYEEAKKFTKADLDKNPKLMKAIEASMPKW